MELHDYHRCFVFTTSSSGGVERNTCRTQLLCGCEITNSSSGEIRKFYLAKECIGENMYLGGDITQTPTSHVWSICSENETRQDKRFASHKRDITQVAKTGEPIVTLSGRLAYLTDYRLDMKTARGRLLGTPSDIIQATLNSEPLVGRTLLDAPDSAWKSWLEYPIPYMNVHPPQDRFQVDVGPILVPDLSLSAGSLITQLRVAYILFNQLDKAEFVRLAPTRVEEDGEAETLHYSDLVHQEVRNQIFSVKS